MATKELTMEELKELLTSTVENAIKELGIGQAEVKHKVLPQETVEKEAEFEKLPSEQKMKEFVKAVLVKDFATVKALGGQTDSEGGFLLPTEFRKELIVELEKVGVMRPLVKVIKVNGRAGEQPKVASKPVYKWGTENSAFNESQPAFEQITYAVKRVDVFTAISRELLADTPINLTQTIKELFTEAYAKVEDEAITKGDGSTIPIVGLVNDSSIPEKTLSSNLTYNDIVEAFLSVSEPYRSKGVWLVNSKGMQILYSLKDKDDRPLLTVPAQGGNLLLFGRPVVENPQIPVYQIDTNGDGTPDTDATYILFGDYKNAYLFDRGEFGIEATTEGGNAFVNHQVLIKAWNRIDFKVAIGNAMVRLKDVR